jgi:outer membrane receptor protein involved in Fe transport
VPKRRIVKIQEALLALLAFLVLASIPADAQVEWREVGGLVTEPGGSPAAAATVELQDALGAVAARALTDAGGRFRLVGIPPGDYWLRAAAPGPLTASQRLSLRGARLEVHLNLQARGAETVEVSAEEESPDVRAGVGGDSVRRLADRLQSRALRDTLSKVAGWPTEDNGLVHHRGADDGFLFVLDGVPVYERLDPLFGLSPDAASIESLQVLSGYVPPQYGLRSGGVVELRSRAATPTDRRFGAEADAAGGSEGTTSAGGLLRARLGSSADALVSGSGERSDRYLDPVDPDNRHNEGRTWTTHVAANWRPSPRDTVVVRGGFGESRFDVPNDPAQDAAGQDQRQGNDDVLASLSWLRTLNPATTAEVALYGRWMRADVHSSPFDTPLETEAARRLSRTGVLAHLAHERGGHRISAGLEAASLHLDERLAFAVTDPEAREEADLSDAALQFRPDDPFRFAGAVRRTQVSVFAQDSWRATDRLTIDGGLRFDATDLLSPETALSPRLGLAYRVSGSVRLRLSANRFFQPPQSEWLLLASSPEARVLSPFADSGGGAPPQAERQWAYEAGLDVWLFGSLRLDTALWHRQVTNFLDPNVFFGTTVLFPNSVASGRASGVDVRLELPPRRGLSGFLAYSYARVIQVGPINGGLFLDDDIQDIGPGTEFKPDHDIPHTATGALRYDAPSGRFAATVSGRYQSGPPLEVSDEGLAALASRPGFDLVDPGAGRVKPHLVFDALVSVRLVRARSAELSASFGGQNLGNERYAFNFGNPFSGTHFGAPRTLSFGLHARFP